LLAPGVVVYCAVVLVLVLAVNLILLLLVLALVHLPDSIARVLAVNVTFYLGVHRALDIEPALLLYCS
jgi:hypothetical protein